LLSPSTSFHFHDADSERDTTTNTRLPYGRKLNEELPTDVGPLTTVQ
jgi:hypothetical protein